MSPVPDGRRRPWPGARNDNATPAGYKGAPSLYDGQMNAKPKATVKPGQGCAPGRPSRSRALAAVLLLVGVVLSLPSAAQPRVGPGSLLVTTEEIGDPSWSQTVVLVLAHDSNGTVGVAINRPTQVPPQELLPEISDVEGNLYRGGPVRPTQIVFLVRNPPPDVLRDAPRILDDVYASGNLTVLPELTTAEGGTSTVRLYAGHVEWAPGELDREIADDQWTVTAGSSDRVFAPNPALLWEALRNSGELLVERTDREAPALDRAEAAINRDQLATREQAPLVALSAPRPRGPAASTDPR